jgi:hypothetical protein
MDVQICDVDNDGAIVRDFLRMPITAPNDVITSDVRLYSF